MRTYDAGGDLARTALALRDDLPLGPRAGGNPSTSLVVADPVRRQRRRRGRRRAHFRRPHAHAAFSHRHPDLATCRSAFSSAGLLQIRRQRPRRGQVVADQRPERGSMVHRILERFFGEVGPAASLHQGTTTRRPTFCAWSASPSRRSASGGTWSRGAPTGLGQRAHRDSRRPATLLEEDAELRSEGGWQPAHLEQAFGMDLDPASWPAVTITVGEGRRVQLRGYIDRVDVDEGGRSRVLDYKTGRCLDKTITVDDLFDAGRRLSSPSTDAQSVTMRSHREGADQ